MSRGTPRWAIRVPEDLWQRFGELAEPDRSAVLREFMKWFVRDPDAKPPKRP